MSSLSSSSSSSPAKVLTVVSQTTLDAVGNTGRYSGSLLVETGLPQGFGEMQYNKTSAADVISSPISCYKGNWNEGKWHGQGVCHMTNSDVYDGQHVAGERHGHGKYLWNDTFRSYEGEFHHNQRHGHGIYRWNLNAAHEAEQSTYTGSFLQGQRQGHGTYQTPNLTYTGEWWAGKYHGYGVISYHNNNNNGSSHQPSNSQKQYRGHFQNGKKHGYGVETNADGTIRHDGTWQKDAPFLPPKENTDTSSSSDDVQVNRNIVKQAAPSQIPFTKVVQSEAIVDALGRAGMYRGILQDGLPQGVGTMVYHQHDDQHPHAHGIQQYEGFWEHGIPHGFGRLFMENGDTYEGNLVQGKRQGRGKYKWKDERHYKGMWSNDTRHGTGVFLYPNNDMYEGEFVSGKRQGQGRFVFCDGSVYVGEWKDGLYNGQGELVTVDGKVYQGSFQGGLYHGLGTKVDGIGTIIYEGEWVRGRPAGEEEPEPILDSLPPYDQRSAQERERLPQSSLPASAYTTSSPRPTPSTTATKRVVTPSSLISKFLGPTSGSKPESSASTYSTTGSSLLSALQAPFLFSAPSPTTASTAPANKSTSSKHQTPAQEDHCKAVVDIRCWDAQNNPGRYTGLLQSTTQRPHGVGRMVYDDGNRIHEGFWDHGNREGYGRCVFLNIGDFHEGDYVQNLRHGPGKYLWKDGRAFMGNYHNDERQGQGVFSYPNGDIYEGNFADGQRSGYGTFKFHNGDFQYKGEWKEGVYEGKGLLDWKVNAGEQITHLYVGEFAGGVFHGQGKESVDGQVEREGIWNQGKFVKSTKPENIPDPEKPEFTPVLDKKAVALEELAKEVENKVSLEDTPKADSPQDDDDDDDILAPPTELERQSSAPIECPTNLEHNYEDERKEWRNSLDLCE
jgi:hypothetical protein